MDFPELVPAWIAVIGAVVAAAISGPVAIYLNSKLRRIEKAKDKKMEIGLAIIDNLQRHFLEVTKFFTTMALLGKVFREKEITEEEARIHFNKAIAELNDTTGDSVRALFANCILFTAFTKRNDWFENLLLPYIQLFSPFEETEDAISIRDEKFPEILFDIVGKIEGPFNNLLEFIKIELKLYKT